MNKPTIIAIVLMAAFVSYCGYRAYHPLIIGCETCHQGWKLQVDNATMPPDLPKIVAHVDEHLIISGHRVRRLDPDSEQFRDALLRNF